MTGHTYHHRADVVSSIKPEFGSGKLVKRHISIGFFTFPYVEEGIHGAVSDVGLESCFSANPVCTFPCYGSLSKLVSKPYFKIRSEKTPFPI